MFVVINAYAENAMSVIFLSVWTFMAIGFDCEMRIIAIVFLSLYLFTSLLMCVLRYIKVRFISLSSNVLVWLIITAQVVFRTELKKMKHA